MDHDMTFYEFIEHLGRDSALRGVAFEAEQSARDLTRGFIFDSWLDIELQTPRSPDYTDPHSNVGRNKDGKDDKSVNKDQAAGACFACGELGHRQDVCTKVDKDKKYDKCGTAGHVAKACRMDKDKKCKKCGIAGHIAKACREGRKGRLATNADTASGGCRARVGPAAARPRHLAH